MRDNNMDWFHKKEYWGEEVSLTLAPSPVFPPPNGKPRENLWKTSNSLTSIYLAHPRSCSRSCPILERKASEIQPLSSKGPRVPEDMEKGWWVLCGESCTVSTGSSRGQKESLWQQFLKWALWTRESPRHFQGVCQVKTIFIMIPNMACLFHRTDTYIDGANAVTGVNCWCFGMNQSSDTRLY